MGKRVTLTKSEIKFMLRHCYETSKVMNTSQKGREFLDEGLEKLIQKLEAVDE